MTPADLIAWRETNGLSQSDLARALGVDHSTVWRWEHGKVAIPPFLNLALNWMEYVLTPDYEYNDV